MNTPRLLVGIAIILAAAAGIFFLTQEQDAKVETEKALTYENATYGYSFAYPEAYALKAYTNEHVSVGTPVGEGFESLTDVSLQEAFSSDGYESFEAFVLERTRTLCAADGPDQTINCTDVVDQQAFASESGETGIEFHLLLAETTFSTGETKTYTYGPVYAFPYQKEGAIHAALLVYQPLPSFMEEVRADVVANVADSLSID